MKKKALRRKASLAKASKSYRAPSLRDYRKPLPKRAVNLSIDAEILRVSKDLKINLSQVLEDELRKLTREERNRRFQEENREAFEEHNRFIEKHGIWSERYRSW